MTSSKPHIQIKYGRREDNSQFFGPDREPSLDLVTPVEHIGGLDNFVVARHGSSGGSAGGSIFGKDYRHAYASCTTLDGSGQTVGIVSLQNGFLPSDIATYRSLAGLPGPAVTINGPAGCAGSPGCAPSGEDTGDIEMVLSMAPAAQIVEFRGSLDAILTNMAAHPEIGQMTSSYFPGNISSTARNALVQMAVQGQSFFNLTSDAGAFTAGQIGGVNDMRCQPNVTLVGGTDLNMSGAGATYVSETTWPQSGGGILSNIVNNTGVGTPIPSYQVGLATTANGGSTTYRNAPDVAANSDTIDLYVNGGQSLWGGTSFSTPLWAGFMALVNQQAANNGLARVGFANPALYKIASSTYAPNFNDITVGSNPSIPGGTTTFNATAGFDLTTGLGSPKCALITTLSTPLTLASAPSVNARGSGVLEIFGRKSDNSIIHRTYNAGFGPWQAMPAITAQSSPASVSWATNRIDVVVLNVGGSIAHSWWNAGGSFANWENLGCCFDSAPAISSWGAQRLDVFAKSGTNIWHRAFDNTNGWLAWENVGGSVNSAPAAVSWGSGRIDLFAKGTGNDIVHTWFNNPNWSGLWESLSCCFDTAPSAASWASGRLDIFAGSGGTLYHQFYNAGWSGLENLSGPIGSAPSATSWANGRIDIMTLTTGSQLYHKFYNNPSGWSGFETLGTLLYESP